MSDVGIGKSKKHIAGDALLKAVKQELAMKLYLFTGRLNFYFWIPGKLQKLVECMSNAVLFNAHNSTSQCILSFWGTSFPSLVVLLFVKMTRGMLISNTCQTSMR